MRPVTKVEIKRPQDAAFLDVTAGDWVDAAGYDPPAADLSSYIATCTILLVDPARSLPWRPDRGVEVRLSDATPAVVFGGWVTDPNVDVPGPDVPRYKLVASSWATRLAEVATGSLNKSGLVDTDRNFLIAQFRDAMAAASLGTDVDDPILVANDAVGWSGVQGTAFLYGTDWSYRPLLDTLRDLVSRVPGTSLRIRPDKIVEYGVFATPAPVALAAVDDAKLMPAAKVIVIDADSYTDEILAAGHFNHVRLGGIGAAEATAIDQVSIGRYGRALVAPYENDENIAAADIVRAANAKLATVAERRVVTVKTTNDVDALEPGQVVSVLVSDVGCIDDEGWSPIAAELYLGTPLQEPAFGYRGELLVQKVRPSWIAPGVQTYEIELGSYVADFDRALAERIGG